MSPQPKDYDDEEEHVRQVLRLVSRIIARPSGNYSEGGGNGEKRLLSWLLGITAILTASFIVGGIVLYGEFASLKATVASGLQSHEHRLDRLERLEERRLGAPLSR